MVSAEQVSEPDQAGHDAVLATFPELADISDVDLREKVLAIWSEIFRESNWEHLGDAPKNPGSVPLSRKLVEHTRSVTLQAVAVAEVVRDIHGIDFDRDVLIAAANLHDVSKLVEYEPTEDGPKKSVLGRFIQHGMYGAHKAMEYDLPIEIVHSIIVHTQHSHDLPDTWEALVVHYVDYLDTDALLFDANAELKLQK